MIKKVLLLYKILYDNQVYLRISKKIVNKTLSKIDLIESGENIIYVNRRYVFCLNDDVIKFLKNTKYSKKSRIKYVLNNIYKYNREEYLQKNTQFNNDFLNTISLLMK